MVRPRGGMRRKRTRGIGLRVRRISAKLFKRNEEEKRTPSEEDVGECDEFEDGRVIVLEVDVGFLIGRFLGKCLEENVKRWDSRPTTKLSSGRQGISVKLKSTDSQPALTSITLFPP